MGCQTGDEQHANTRLDPRWGGYLSRLHHAWIEEIKRALNAGILPADYYAMAEQHAAGSGPDVLTLENTSGEQARPVGADAQVELSEASGLLLAEPSIQLTAESDMEFYRRKQKSVAVRHVSGDRIVAMIEIVSPGNKSGKGAIRAFVEKAAQLLEQRIHLLILDLHPPGRRDVQGIHGVIWEEISGQDYTAPPGRPLTLASYQSSLSVRAYVVHARVGDELTDMCLFIEPGAHVVVPLQTTYQSAFGAVPRRWRSVLEPAGK